ncbi:MAG: RICIN domain-containing protein [Saprospiraceae bacterium]|nr:RICIN domain-containing protein [Saprospiraceae bacterium]
MKKIGLSIILMIGFVAPKLSALNGNFVMNTNYSKVLDADRGNVRNNGCKLQVWDYVSNSPNQKWRVEDMGGGKHKITCVASDKVIDGNIDVSRTGDGRLWASNDDNKQRWILTPSGPYTEKGQGYIVTNAATNNILQISPNGGIRNGTVINISSNDPSKIGEVTLWYFQAEIKLTLKGISLDGLHNNDCSRAYGSVRVELWTANGDGSAGVKDPQNLPNNGTMMNWANMGKNQPPTAITNYATLTDYNTINNVNKTVYFLINPIYLLEGPASPDAALRSRTFVLKVFTTINTHHKSCDLCSDYSPGAGMNRTEEQSLYIRSALILKERRSFSRKDGPLIAGPYIGSNRRDHIFRVHFDVDKN